MGLFRDPRRRWGCWAALGAAAVIPCGFLGFLMALSAGSSSGSPALAEEWRAEFAGYAGPDDAVAHDPEVLVGRYGGGEWVFGRAVQSHGIWRRGGGTVVVKDSRGRTRAFFGHVCGGGHLGVAPSAVPDLDSFYRAFGESGFREHHFTDAPAD